MITTLIMLGLLSSPVDNSFDTTFVLRYDLPIGTSYTYHVTTDQFVVPQSAVRLHSKLKFDVLSRDASANLLCRLRLMSDTNFSSEGKDLYEPQGKLTFAGNRLYSGVGYMDLLFDEFGHIMRSQQHLSGQDSLDDELLSVPRAMDAARFGVAADVGPYGANLVMPALPNAYELKYHQMYIDTVLFTSRIMHMPTNYGTSATSERKMYYDTLIRVSTLDSTCMDDMGMLYGYMTLKGERRNAFGARYKTHSSIIRDMHTGLITYVSEMCHHKNKRDEWAAYYRVSAELVGISRTPRRR